MQGEGTWERIEEHYTPRIKSVARKFGLAGDDVDDLTQMMLLVLWDAARSFDPEKGSFRGWAHRVVSNQIHTYLRKRPDNIVLSTFSDETLQKLEAALLSEIDAESERLELVEELGHIIQALTKVVGERDMGIYVARRSGRSTVKQIAEEMGRDPGVIRRAIRRVQAEVDRYVEKREA